MNTYKKLKNLEKMLADGDEVVCGDAQLYHVELVLKNLRKLMEHGTPSAEDMRSFLLGAIRNVGDAGSHTDTLLASLDWMDEPET
ncbi:hypothetical protein OAU50_04430 [Planctomycetota bacterium]|nr:hypothetical protein [Planctomycetota bacterium]